MKYNTENTNVITALLKIHDDIICDKTTVHSGIQKKETLLTYNVRDAEIRLIFEIRLIYAEQL